MIDEGFNVLVKLCELGRVLHVLEVLDLLVRDRVGADGDSGCLADLRVGPCCPSSPRGRHTTRGVVRSPRDTRLASCLASQTHCRYYYTCVDCTVRQTRKQEPSKHSDLFISETVQILYKSRKVAVHHALHIILYTVPSLACANRIRLFGKQAALRFAAFAPQAPARNDVKKLRFGRSSPLQSPTGGTSAPGACNICGTAQALCQS